MKARTKLEVEVTEGSSRLRIITQSELEWAYQECLDHKGFRTKKRILCMDCGETIDNQNQRIKYIDCPHCHTKLTIKNGRNTTDEQEEFFAIAETWGGFQVLRFIRINAYYKKGKPKRIYTSEILQHWIRDDGKTTYIGRQNGTSYGVGHWHGDWSIRKESRYSWYRSKYEIYPYKYHPDSHFKEQYEKKGINSSLMGITFSKMVDMLSDARIETILKEKKYDILLQVAKSRSILNQFWQSIRISFKNKYKIKDASMWFDYLELLKYFKKDLNNAYYVCPKNLKKEHDRLFLKKQKILEKLERERKRKEAIERQKRLEEYEKAYAERIQVFLGLFFKKGNIEIEVLKSIDDFKEESIELLHCVFANEYYLRENSLCFSAKVNKKRTETIELDLTNFKINQARGLNNKPSDYNSQIVSLFKKNIPKIKKIINKSQQLSA